MSVKISTELTAFRKGEALWTENPPSTAPVVEEGDMRPLASFAEKRSVCALACMYCGSTGPRTDEHVVPYALNGKIVVYRGSCSVCQEKTQHFEMQMLRSEMANVRYIKGFPSRSKHTKATPLDVTIEKDGEVESIRVPLDEAPIMLSFPIFPLPKMCTGDPSFTMDIRGTVAASYGRDAEEFLRAHGAQSLHVTGRTAPVALARCVAKIAYGWAWMARLYDAVPALPLLCRAFMDEPDTLGRFVGTDDEPYRRYDATHRVGTLSLHGDILCMDVQLFADAGAPTYVVALGPINRASPLSQMLLTHLESPLA